MYARQLELAWLFQALLSSCSAVSIGILVMYKITALSVLHNALENAVHGQQTTTAEVFNRSLSRAHTGSCTHKKTQTLKWALGELNIIKKIFTL